MKKIKKKLMSLKHNELILKEQKMIKYWVVGNDHKNGSNHY